MPESCLYRGEVMHRRLRPLRHRFVYRVLSILVDVDELPALDRRLRLFAYNRRALFSFHDRDHGARDGSRLRPWIETHLARHGVELAGGRILLHCMPRLLGYVFDPLSIFWCYGADGALKAIVYEVKNTFGEQHGYLVRVDHAVAPGATLRHGRDKLLFVSPFNDMAMHYTFRLREPEARMAIAISASDAAGPVLVATHHGDRRALSDRELAKAFIAYPLVTLMVFVAIHWEALKLFLKGASYRSRGRPPGEEVSA